MLVWQSLAAAGMGFKFFELALGVFVGRTQRVMRRGIVKISVARTFGVDLRARYAQMNFNPKRQAARRLRCPLKHDMARRHMIIESLQAADYFPCRGLE